MSEQPASRSVLCNIANCAMDVVSNLLRRDQLLAESLRSSETLSRQIFREESITVEMAAALKERFPAHVDVTLFTSAEETINGADWYWRIQKGTDAIHARVQAKRVQRSTFGQLDRDGVIRLDIQQLNTLVERAELDQEHLPGLQAWIATYGRHDGLPPCGREPNECNRHGCGGACANKFGLQSIWIAEAQTFAIGPRANESLSMRAMVESSVRLDCLLPCIDLNTGRGPGVKGLALVPGLGSFEESVAAIQRQALLRSTFRGAIQIRV